MAYKKCLIATTKNLFDIDSVSFFTKDSNGEYKSNKHIHTDDILWIPVDNTKQVTISGYIKCPVGKNYMFRIVYTDGTDLYKDLISTGNYIYQTITSDSSKTVSYIGFIYNSGSGEVYIKDVQIELNSTATSYVPYGYLPSYKKIIKVNNNPVQLLDKSKYPATTTIRGVTFTNNGDGSYTVNGTATANAYISLFNDKPDQYLRNGHRYLLYDNAGITYLKYTTYINVGGGNVCNTSDNGYLLWNKSDYTLYNCYIRVQSGVTVTNAIFRPQFIDLTAMFGKGNEPTTLQEFRAKYPNSYYDYNPSQYLISYRKNLVTDGSTKNLFDFSKWISGPYDVANGKLVERLSNGAICQGNNGTGDGGGSYSNGWFRPMFNSPNSNQVHLQAGTYTLSADYTMIENSVVSTATVNCYLYGDHQYTNANTTSVTVGNTVRVKNTYTVEEGYYYPVFTLNSGKVRVTNIQIEEGSTSTLYVPYQYL